jgi:acyl carrier protein
VSTPDIQRTVKSFIEEDLLDGEQIDEDTSLFGGGLIDSMNLVQLLGFIESEFKVKVPTSAVNISNLDSVGAISELVNGLRA